MLTEKAQLVMEDETGLPPVALPYQQLCRARRERGAAALREWKVQQAAADFKSSCVLAPVAAPVAVVKPVRGKSKLSASSLRTSVRQGAKAQPCYAEGTLKSVQAVKQHIRQMSAHSSPKEVRAPPIPKDFWLKFFSRAAGTAAVLREDPKDGDVLQVVDYLVPEK